MYFSNPLRQVQLYLPTHARASPWLIGILLGYNIYRNEGYITKPKKVLVTHK